MIPKGLRGLVPITARNGVHDGLVLVEGCSQASLDA